MTTTILLNIHSITRIDALEHVKVDHQFFQSHQQDFTVELGAVTILPQVFRIPEPFVTILPQTTWLRTAEPHPLARHSDQTILRGPPSVVNAAV